MEPFNNSYPDKEPSAKQLDQLLQDAYEFIQRIITDHHHEDDVHAATVSVTALEAEENNRLENISVRDIDGNKLEVTITKNDSLGNHDSITEHYQLSYVFGTGEYELLTAGLQSTTIDNSELRQAAATEIVRLADILEIAAFGHIPFYPDLFEDEFHAYVDGLNSQ